MKYSYSKIVFPISENLLEITDNKDILDLSIKVDNLLKQAFDTVI